MFSLLLKDLISDFIYKRDVEFTRNTSIKLLNISANMIETTERGSFDFAPPKLEVLDVSGNRPILEDMYGTY